MKIQPMNFYECVLKAWQLQMDKKHAYSCCFNPAHTIVSNYVTLLSISYLHNLVIEDPAYFAQEIFIHVSRFSVFTDFTKLISPNYVNTKYLFTYVIQHCDACYVLKHLIMSANRTFILRI